MCTVELIEAVSYVLRRNTKFVANNIFTGHMSHFADNLGIFMLRFSKLDTGLILDGRIL
jgi:hypothetical protein